MANAKLPRIPRSVLNEMIKQLPGPVQEHSQRTKRLAAFMLERIASEEWFLETGYVPEALASAVYYHDIGKLNLPPDDMYLTGRVNDEKRKRYYSHTEEGLNAVIQKLGTSLDGYREKSFGGILKRVITEHHKPYTQTGAQDEYGERTFTLPGSLTAVADAFDNLLFVGKGAGGDLDQSVAELKERAGKDLDPLLVEALTGDMNALEAFAGTLTSNWIYKRRQDKYGIGFTFRQACGAPGEESYLIAEPFLNDIYYGRINRAAFMSVAEDSDQIFTLERLCLEHLASYIRRINGTGSLVPPLLYRISPKELEHPTFLHRTAVMLSRYGVQPGQVIIALRDSDIADFHLNAEDIARELHSEGMGFAITDLGGGNSVMARIGTINPDKAILADNLPGELAKGLSAELKKNGIQVPAGISEPFEEWDLPYRMLEVMSHEAT